MIINLKVQKDGEWFPFFYSTLNPETMEITYSEPLENGPRMKIRDPVPFFKERTTDRKKVTEWVLNKKTRAMEKVTTETPLSAEEQLAENDDFADYVIVGVEGFKLEGKEAECTREDKIAMMSIPMISMYVNRCITLLQESGVQEEKDEVKNSSTGSRSKTTKRVPG